MRVLIIRSASMERLDCLMSSLALSSMESPTAADVAQYDVLTHPHAAAGVRTNYPKVNVIEYVFQGDFNRKNAQRIASEGKMAAEYDKIIVLISNLSGKGHHNVISTALFFGKNVELFNINGEFIKFKTVSFIREILIRLLLSPLVISATLLLSIWGIFKLIAGLAPISRKEVEGYGEATG
ncbi:MAG: hypothetical protein ACE5EN_04555 [Nitrospinota bacterium]